MSIPEPIATGTLEQTPLAHVLLKILERELDGTLAIWPEDGSGGQDRVLFEKGHPVAARLLQSAGSLERGLLPLFRRMKAPYAFYPADLIGQAVSVRGRVDPWLLIAAALRGGARQEIVDALLARYGQSRLRVKRGTDLSRFGFIPKERAFLDMLRAEPQTVPYLIDHSGNAKVARRTLYLLTITQCLEVFKGEVRPPTGQHKLPPRASKPVASFEDIAAELTSEELPIPDFGPEQEREDPTGTQPIAVKPGEHRRSMPPRRSVPPVTESGSHKAISATPPAPKRFDIEPPPEPPPNLSSDLLAHWVELSELALAVHDMNYFEMLGVASSAGADDVRNAFFALVKKWHPDRLPAELKALAPWNDQIFHHLSEAERVLSDTAERAKYIKSVQGGGGTPRQERKLNAILTAAMEFQKVEVLLRRKHYDEAMQILDQILELAPDEADYLATKGMIIFRSDPKDRSAQDLAMKWLEQALERNDRNERALMAMAEIYERRGQREKSLELYRKVVSINPKNLDATRQVRLATMRGQSKRPGKSKGSKASEGLLSKFFGKKK